MKELAKFFAPIILLIAVFLGGVYLFEENHSLNLRLKSANYKVHIAGECLMHPCNRYELLPYGGIRFFDTYELKDLTYVGQKFIIEENEKTN